MSELIEAVKSFIFKRVKVLSRSLSVNALSVVKDTDIAEKLSTKHDKYFVVPAGKAENNIVIVCKTRYTKYLLSEVDEENYSSNKTHIATTIKRREP